MKVCIATFHHESHPGAVLQAYALAKTIGELGHTPELLRYQRPVREFNPNKLRHRMLRMLTQATLRDSIYASFRIQYFDKTPKKYQSYEEIVSDPPDADVYVCGSDQIWNPSLLRGNNFDPAYFLQFGQEDIARVSYAASFGGYQPSPTDCDLLRNYLEKFQHISVREPHAQALLKTVLGREIKLTVDPTLLRENYDELLSQPKGSDDYVLVYALQFSEELLKTSRMIAARMKKPLWTHGGPWVPWKVEGKRKQERGPIEWLEMINGAAAVVTNSFHGVVFGLLLRKRVIFVPLTGALKARNERILHLLDLLGIADCVIGDSHSNVLQKEIPWDSVNARMKEYRADSLEFLRTAIAPSNSSQL